VIAMSPDMRMGEQPERAGPCTLVIFGASGDLTQRLLMPTLYHLLSAGLLSDAFAVIGVARSDLSQDAFRRRAQEGIESFAGVKPKSDTVAQLLDRLHYVQGGDDSTAFQRVAETIARVDRDKQTGGNCLFYLATPPSAITPIIRHLGKAGLAREEKGWRRIIIEKPFGVDLASAKALNQEALTVFTEPQIYRIDHYLGKETVQNILALRFGNGLFESLWNRDRIDHVQITVAETLSVEGRGGFYDATGALRDMVPNHLFQLLSLVTMEPPAQLAADSIHTEKVKLLQAVQPFSSDKVMRDAVRGQYGAGTIQGKTIMPYRHASGVTRGSVTETFIALRLCIDNWRWAGVPFYLRTGKALAARRTEVAIKFKAAPLSLFRTTPIDALAENFIIIRIQPDEGIALQFNAKVPGPQLRLDGVRMDFKYKDYFDSAPSTGYETLIYDCMTGDNTLFQRADEVEAAWRIVQPFLDDWREAPNRDFGIYPAGSEGPPESDELLARDGRHWRPIAMRRAS
jgi:glucose-6-phosphate 1-dehydrogenase